MIHERISNTIEQLEYVGSGEVFDFVFPLMELLKEIVKDLEDELISPHRWVSKKCLIKWLLEIMGKQFPKED
jgi:hypothetical protein